MSFKLYHKYVVLTWWKYNLRWQACNMELKNNYLLFTFLNKEEHISCFSIAQIHP